MKWLVIGVIWFVVWFAWIGETKPTKFSLWTVLGSGLVAARLAANGCFVSEISAHQPSPDGGVLSLIDRREYGGSAVLLYAHAANA